MKGQLARGDRYHRFSGLRHSPRSITSLLGCSKAHWTQNEAAHGDKRNPEDLARWRELAKISESQTDRALLSEQADSLEDFRGARDLHQIMYIAYFDFS